MKKARIANAINLNLPAILGLALWLSSLCVTSYSHDTQGNLNSTINQATSYANDTANRLKKITDAKQGVTQFGYNARSQRLSVTDAKGQVYGFTYDPLGRPLTTTRGGSTLTYAYTNGVRTARTDYNGAVTSYSYDALNRLTTITYPGGGTATYGYDALSRLTAATNVNGTVALGYDTRNRVSSVTDVWGQVVSYGYDASSNRTQIALPNYSLTYQYDQINRLTQLTHNLVGTASFSYDAVNRPTGRTLPNAMTVTAQYDGLDRLTRLTHARNGTTLADYQYQFNADNQITQMTEGVVTHSLGYDELQRLTSATHTTQVPEFYNYDAVGNRTASQQAALYSYQTPNRVVQIGSTTYTYDNNGNLKTKTEALALTTQYFYDHENRLTSVMLPNATTINYKYDALGRRVERSRSGGTWQRYSYDGLEVVRDSNSDGSSVEYVNGGELDDHLWQRASGGATHYFLTDHQGSTRVLADANGAVAASYSYDTFGNGFSGTTTRFGYTGREHDSETGLIYYRARWYDPGQGRFVSEDPIGLAGGINQFAYVENDPFGATDPLGLFRFPRPGGKTFPKIRPKFDIKTGPSLLRKLGVAGAIAGLILGSLPLPEPEPSLPPSSPADNPGPGENPCDNKGGGKKYYRGGSDMTRRPGEVKMRNGLVRGGRDDIFARGLSFWDTFEKADMFPGGAYLLVELPPGLIIARRGTSPGHYEVIAEQDMPLDEFDELLKRVKLRKATCKE